MSCVPLRCFLVCLLGSLLTAPAVEEAFAVTIRVDAQRSLGPLRQVWRFFGADEPNYVTMKDGQKLLADFGALRPKQVYFRAHNLLTSGDGTPALKWGSTDAYREDEQGDPIYDWKILDLMFDSCLERDVRPYVQIGFMPEALSTHPDPYRHEWRPGFPYDRIFTGWAFPPREFEKWGELVHQWAKHCVERYGASEVETWYWETWNEANIGSPTRPGYFRGTVEQFHKLHDYAIDGVRRALPNARVGGPDSAGSGGDWTRRFLDHCLYGTNYVTGEIGTPLDFVSFHAKGSPDYVDGHVRMGIATHLRTVDEGFGIVASFPELRNTPIIIGESDPEGCAACQGSRFTYRNGTMYSSYTAASFARKHDLADRHGVNFEGALTWAFTFEDQPYFAGFRQLASCGLPLPVFNVFRMFSRMSGNRVAVESTAAVPLDTILRSGVREVPDVTGFASYDATTKRTAIMVWHYHDDDLPGPDAAVELALSGLSGEEASLNHYRIDEQHSNAFAEWQRMGSPVAPDLREYARLQESSNLVGLEGAPATVAVQNGTATIHFNLPRQGVSLLLVEGQ
jgi:xylan 1,4-beta-xylosidase